MNNKIIKIGNLPKDAAQAYVALKAILGDTINGSDFDSLAAKSVPAGVFAKLKSAAGASVLTEEESKAIVEGLEKTFNEIREEYNKDVEDYITDSEFAEKARKRFLFKKGGKKADAETKTETKTKKGIPVW